MFALLAFSIALAAPAPAKSPAATPAIAALTPDEEAFVAGLAEYYDALCDARAHAAGRVEDKQLAEAADEFKQIAAKATELEQQVTRGQTLPVWTKPLAFKTRDGAFDARTFPSAIRAFHDDMLAREKTARGPPSVSATPAFAANATPLPEIVFLNVKTKKFHCASCASAQKCTKNCAYVERTKAESLGGVACRLCGGTCR